MAFFNKIKEDFTIIPNGIFKDCTMNEVALISYIASKPSGWLFRAKTIGEVFRVERKNIQRILRSLEKKGYLKRIKHNNGIIDYILCYPPFSYSNVPKQDTGLCIPMSQNRTQPMSQNVSEAKWDTLVRQSKDSNTKKKLSKDSKERTFVTPELFESNILEIPLILQTPEFVDCYIQWLEHLKEKKKLPTLSAVKQQLADCAGWGVYQAIRNLKFSIGKNYQGIFPDKTDKFHTLKEITLKDIPPDGGF